MRNYILNKLTQVSAWMGIIIFLGAFMLPKTIIAFIGILLILNDDAKLQSLSRDLKAQVEKWWI